MSKPNSSPQPVRKEDALGLSLDQLRQALAADVPGREREWAEAVEGALARVGTALGQHRADARAPDGLLAEVDETRPTLARQAEELRGDHEHFLAQLRTLRQDVRRAAEAFQPGAGPGAAASAGGVADFGAIRRQAEQLMTGLEVHREAETKLVLESVNTDIGVGD
jgi:hypothetical protein